MACEGVWKFVKSYKQMFWYSYGDVTVCVYGDTYREEFTPEYTYEDFLIAIISDEDICVDEVDK